MQCDGSRDETVGKIMSPQNTSGQTCRAIIRVYGCTVSRGRLKSTRKLDRMVSYPRLSSPFPVKFQKLPLRNGNMADGRNPSTAHNRTSESGSCCPSFAMVFATRCPLGGLRTGDRWSSRWESLIVYCWSLSCSSSGPICFGARRRRSFPAV